eukprot:gene6192-6259_t
MRVKRMVEVGADIHEVIGLAWADDVTFEAIEQKLGLSEANVIALMRANLKPGSFRAWRKRVSGRKTKHREPFKRMLFSDAEICASACARACLSQSQEGVNPGLDAAFQNRSGICVSCFEWADAGPSQSWTPLSQEIFCAAYTQAASDLGHRPMGELRLYFGFSMVVLLGLALAMFGLWQLSGIQQQVSKASALSDNVIRALEISNNLQAIRRAILRYDFDADESSFEEAAHRETVTVDLLQAAAKATLSSERLTIYRNVEEIVVAMRAKREELGVAVKKMLESRETYFRAGDILTRDVADLLESARANSVDPTIIQGSTDLQAYMFLARTSGLRFLASRDPKHLEAFKENIERVQAQIDLLGIVELPEDIHKHLDSAKASYLNYITMFNLTSTNLMKSDALYNGDVRKLAIESLDQTEKALNMLRQDFNLVQASTSARITDTINIQVIVGGGAFLLGSLLAFFMARGISNPLVRLCAAMKSLAAGQFNVVLPGLQSKDEIGDIARAVEAFKVKAEEKSRIEAENVRKQHEVEAERETRAAEARQRLSDEQSGVVRRLAEALQSLAAGNLNVQLHDGFSETYAQIRDNFNEAVDRLRDTIGAVASSTGTLVEGMTEISAASNDLARRTEQQAAGLEETAAALDEMTATVKKSAEGAAHARSISAEADLNANQGAEIVGETVSAMDAIANNAMSEEAAQLSGLISQFQIGHGAASGRARSDQKRGESQSFEARRAGNGR